MPDYPYELVLLMLLLLLLNIKRLQMLTLLIHILLQECIEYLLYNHFYIAKLQRTIHPAGINSTD